MWLSNFVSKKELRNGHLDNRWRPTPKKNDDVTNYVINYYNCQLVGNKPVRGGYRSLREELGGRGRERGEGKQEMGGTVALKALQRLE